MVRRFDGTVRRNTLSRDEAKRVDDPRVDTTPGDDGDTASFGSGDTRHRGVAATHWGWRRRLNA